MSIPLLFIEAATRLLKCGGFVAFEHHESQAAAMVQALSTDYTEIKSSHDLTGRPRFTTAFRKKRE